MSDLAKRLNIMADWFDQDPDHAYKNTIALLREAAAALEAAITSESAMSGKLIERSKGKNSSGYSPAGEAIRHNPCDDDHTAERSSETCGAAPTPSHLEQLASAKPQDEAEMRARAAEIATANPLVCALCLAALPNPDCGHRANGQTPCCVPATDNLADDIFEALKQERARARREAMDDIVAKRVPGYSYDALHALRCEHGWMRHECATCSSRSLSHPEAKAEERRPGHSKLVFDKAAQTIRSVDPNPQSAPPDPLDRPVTWRDLIVAMRKTYGRMSRIAVALERSALSTEER